METEWNPAPAFACCVAGKLYRGAGPATSHKGVQLWNLYGPTETTIWSAIRQVTQQVPDETSRHGNEGSNRLAIQINNTQIHILDAHYQPYQLVFPRAVYRGTASPVAT
jgi:non-ribosomal peptide synthetase component F